MLQTVIFRSYAVGLAILCSPLVFGAPAQQPTPAQVQAQLRDPGMADRLRAEIARGGLTPDQVRARLRAAGYPESLLDDYLGNHSSGNAAAPPPSDLVLDAVRALGLADSLTVARVASEASASPITPDTGGRYDGLPIFGLEVFRRSTSRFEPALAGSVSPNYRIGPGDVLALIVTGDVERAYSLEVSRDGFVLIPQVGQVFVANFTLGQAEDLIFARLRRSYGTLSRAPGASARMYLSVSRLRSNQVFVIGEVRNPGSYLISSVGTAFTALYAAGGPTDHGTLRNVVIRRSTAGSRSVDVYDYLLRGESTDDVTLQAGDVVFIGVHTGRVSIRGAVIRPAAYELGDGMTLTELIQAAGGFTTEAAQQRVQVRRVLPADQREAGGRDRVVLDISPSEFLARNAPPFRLLPGDRIEVFQISTPERNALTVTGNVWNPGVVGFRPGMTLSQALAAAGGVQPDVYLGQVLISRRESGSTRRSIHAALRDSLGTVVEEIMLQEDDSVRVFSRSDFTPDRYVAIAGAVRKGGQFPYREGMTLRELLLLADGPLESADLREAEIARFPSQRRPGVLAQTFRIPLDSSYVFELQWGAAYSGPVGVSLPGGRAPEVLLKPYDNVLIFRQPDWKVLGGVTIVGEVMYPGTYTIRNTTERLSDVVGRAGGLTPTADPQALIFYRRSEGTGRIGTNVASALRHPQSKDNFTVIAGDSITVSPFRPYVRVTGAVNAPIAVPHVSGASLNYYIAAAGGPSRMADARRSYVTQPNGSVESRRWLLFVPGPSPQPRPGSTVFVPQKDPEAKSDAVELAGIVTPILASLVTILALLLR